MPMRATSKISISARILLFFLRTYQYAFSPHFGTQCRFTPTCSHYAADALTKHGSIKGSYLTARRLLRCHPWCQGGYDPAP